MAEPTIPELAARLDERDRRYLDRIDALAKRVEQRFDAEQRALEHARSEIAHRLEGMNEFRAQIQKERGNFVTRDLFDARTQQIEGKLVEQGGEIQKLRSGVGYMYFIGGLFLAAVLTQVFRIVW